MDKYEIINESNFTKTDMRNIDLSQVEQINGLPYLDILSSLFFNSTIILFGDVHLITKKGFVGDTNKSLYLPLYLDALFKKYPRKQFDLITETPYNKNENYIMKGSNSGILGNIVKQFIGCYRNIYDKTDCITEYPNLRVHMTDIRKIQPSIVNKLTSSDNEDKLNSFKNLGAKLEPWINYDWLTSISNRILDSFYLDDKIEDNIGNEILLEMKRVIDNYSKHGEFGEFMFNLLESENSKFIKYRNIEGYDKLKYYIIHQLELIYYCYNPRDNIYKLISRCKDFDIVEINGVIKSFKRLIISTGVAIFDYYSLIRFLKIKRYGNANNIIMIAGATHIKNIRAFINYMDEDGILVRYSNTERTKLDNILKSIVESYSKTTNDAFILKIYKINNIYISKYLKKIQRTLITKVNKSKREEKLLLLVDNLIRIYRLSSISKYDILYGKKCLLNREDFDDIQQFRCITIKSSDIESELI